MRARRGSGERRERLKSAIGILECKLRVDKHLLNKYNIVLGDIVYAEAEKGIFTDRWRPENKGKRMIHHLGGNIFSVPGPLVLS